MPSPWPPFVFVGAVLLMTAGLLEGWIDITQGAMVLASLTGAWMLWWVTVGEAACGPQEVQHAQ